MSFIYDDKKLLQSLIDAAEQSLKKKAQAASPNQGAINGLAQKLIQQMMRQVQPESAPAATAPIGTEDGTAPELKRENLQTLGDFLQWAANNKVTWDGKRVAWIYNKDTDQGEKPPAGAWKFQTYTIDRSRDAYDRTPVTVPAYADKDALVKLLASLRDSSEAKNEKVFEVMLGRVISQTNQFLEKDEQIGHRTEAPKQTFNPATPVDGFKDSVLNIKDPYAGIQDFMSSEGGEGAPVKITYQDVSSKSGLIDWLRNMKYVDETGKEYGPTDPGANPCGALHVLYLRAKYLSQYGTDKLRANFSELSKAYLNAIQEIGGQFDFNGQACAITIPGTTTSQNQNEQGQQGQSGLNPQTLQELASLRPFNSQEISFQEIELFCDKYAQLANNPVVTSAAFQVKTAINGANSRLLSPGAPIQMDNLTTAQLRLLTRQPLPLVNDLFSIISTAGRIYQDFYNSYKRILGDAAARPIEQQITSGGPQQTNISTLMRLSEILKNEVRQGKQ